METSRYAALRSNLQEMKRSPAATVEEARAQLDALFGGYPLPEGTQRTAMSVGNLPAEWVHTGYADPDRAILYLHGGAYVRGSFASHAGLVARISAASGIRALVLGYRLAPEYPFPCALKDALTAYRWLLAQGVQPEHIVLAGDSAGGGLSVATLLALRDAGHPLPAGAALMSPWTDLALSGESMRTRAEVDPWLASDRLTRSAGSYLGNADPRDPHASPLYGDLHGLPPLLIHVGTDEIILDDSTRLAERATSAGVPVTIQVWNDMWHVFQAFATEVFEGQESIDQIGAFIRQCTNAPERHRAAAITATFSA